MSRDGAIETWSKLVGNESDIPVHIRNNILEVFSTFPYCVFTPSSRGSYGRSPASFLCLGEGKIVIIKAINNARAPIVLSLDVIDAIESGKSLLLAWIAFHHSGIQETLWYNTVSSDFYNPFIEAYRTLWEKRIAPCTSGSSELLEPMRLLDYKYYTFPHAVLGDRPLSAQFYHPSSPVEPRFLFSRQINSYFLIYADGLLYTFSEDALIRSPRTASYSMVIRYIPLDRETGWVEEKGTDAHSWYILSSCNNEIFRMPVARDYKAAFVEFTEQCAIKIDFGLKK